MIGFKRMVAMGAVLLLAESAVCANTPPFLRTGPDRNRTALRVDLKRDFARESGWPVVDLYAIMKGRHEQLVLKDGVHLNPAGQRVFADAVCEALKR